MNRRFNGLQRSFELPGAKSEDALQFFRPSDLGGHQIVFPNPHASGFVCHSEALFADGERFFRLFGRSDVHYGTSDAGNQQITVPQWLENYLTGSQAGIRSDGMAEARSRFAA